MSVGFLVVEFVENRKGIVVLVECFICYKKFFSKYYLKVYNRKYIGEKFFECFKCGKCYFWKENFLEYEVWNCMNCLE